MRQYMDKLGLSARQADRSATDEASGMLEAEMNQLNARYTKLISELHQRLSLMKQVYDDTGNYFPVSTRSHLLRPPQCNTFDFGCGSARSPTGGSLCTLPDPRAEV